MDSKILYGKGELHPKYRLELILTDPDGKEFARRVQREGELDYARPDWDRFDSLPEALQGEILDELEQVVQKEVLRA